MSTLLTSAPLSSLPSMSGDTAQPIDDSIGHNAPRATFTPLPDIPPEFAVERDSTFRRRQSRDGRRRITRRDNARFAGNPHIVHPLGGEADYIIPPRTRPTFPEPPCIPRNTPAPSPPIPSLDPASANAGKFKISMKGLRRVLQHAGPRLRELALEVDQALREWINDCGVIVLPNVAESTAITFPGRPIDSACIIREASRTMDRLVWSVDADAFTRYIIHCTARKLSLLSYSKDANDHQRLTYIQRPNMTRPEVKLAVLSPPTSDYDLASMGSRDSDSEASSDVEAPTNNSHETRQAARLLPVVYEEAASQHDGRERFEQADELADDEAYESDATEVSSHTPLEYLRRVH